MKWLNCLSLQVWKTISLESSTRACSMMSRSDNWCAANYTLKPSDRKQRLWFSMNSSQCSCPFSTIHWSRGWRVSGHAQQIFKAGLASAVSFDATFEASFTTTGVSDMMMMMLLYMNCIDCNDCIDYEWRTDQRVNEMTEHLNMKWSQSIWSMTSELRTRDTAVIENDFLAFGDLEREENNSSASAHSCNCCSHCHVVIAVATACSIRMLAQAVELIHIIEMVSSTNHQTFKNKC